MTRLGYTGLAILITITHATTRLLTNTHRCQHPGCRRWAPDHHHRCQLHYHEATR